MTIVDQRSYSPAMRARMREAQKMRSPWTPEKVAWLRKLAADSDGWTALHIGDALGFSRGAVIGKCQRLGIRLKYRQGRPSDFKGVRPRSYFSFPAALRSCPAAGVSRGCVVTPRL